MISRRTMIGAVGAAALGATVVSGADVKNRRVILGIACSPRQQKSTSSAMRVALDAAASVDPSIRAELIDLGGMSIGGWNGSGFPTDDFQTILPKLRDPNVAGLIVGSPVYFRSMSALCKAFIEQCQALRKPQMLLANKLIGALAVGKSRNGGQELVVQQIQNAMLCHEMLIVGGKHPYFQGGTLVSVDDAIDGDDYGITSATNLGRRMAEVALMMH